MGKKEGGSRFIKLVERVIDNRVDSSEVFKVLQSTSTSEMLEGFRLFQDAIERCESQEKLTNLTNGIANLLLYWSSYQSGPDAVVAASVAKKLFETSLNNPEAVAVANHVISILTLDPAGLTDLAESGLLDDKAKAKVLSLLGQKQSAKAFVEAATPEIEQPASESEDLTPQESAQQEQAPEESVRQEPETQETVQLKPAAVEPQVTVSYQEGFDLLDAGDAEGGLAYFQQHLEDGVSRQVLDGLLEARRQLSQPDEAIAELEQLRNTFTGKEEEILVLPVLASAYMDKNLEVDAERIWRRVRAIDPRNLEALSFYEDYLRSRGDYQKLYTILQFAISVVESDEERLRIAREMAVLARDHLHNLDRAIDALRRVLAVAPDDPDAQEDLIVLYEMTGKWLALVEFHNDRIRRLPDDAVDQKVSILFELISIYQDPERLASPDNVLATYARIVELSPTHVEALETLAKGYYDRERWPELLRVLQKKVILTQDPAELLGLFKQIASIAIDRMSNETQAIPFLERVLELNPDNLDVVRRLKGIYERKHNQERLFAMHLREMEMLEGEAKVPVILAAAKLARDQLLRHDEALRLYEAAYHIKPDLREIRENLHLLYARQGKWPQYVQFLSEEIERPMPERRRTDLMQIIGEIRMDRLDDPEGAREIFEKILVDDPDNDVAARRLELLYLDTGDLESLLHVYRLKNDVRTYVSVLTHREAREPDIQAKVQLNLSAANVCAKDLGDEARALTFLDKAFTLDPTLTSIGNQLLDAYLANGNLAKAAETLKSLVGTAESDEERLELAIKRRDLLENMAMPREAMLAGIDILKTGAIDAELFNDTLDRIRASATVGGLWFDFAKALGEAILATDDLDLQRELLLEQGLIYEERLLYHDEARDALNRVIELDPNCIQALDMLERIAFQQEDYVAMEAVLRQRAAIVQNTEELFDLTLRRGRLYEDLLEDDLGAIECYSSLLADDPENREALTGLHRTLERAERFPDLAEIIQKEIAISRSSREAGSLNLELADIYLDKLHDYASAIDALKEVLGDEQNEDKAVSKLKELFEAGISRDVISNILAPHFRGSENFEQLFWLLEERSSDLDVPEARAALFLQMADIKLNLNEDLAAVFDLVGKAVSENPTPYSASRLLELAKQADKNQEAAQILAPWVDESATKPKINPELEASLARSLGELYAQELDSPELAIQAFEKALLIGGEVQDLLLKVLELNQKTNRKEDALFAFDRLANIAADDDDQLRKVQLDKAEYAKSIDDVAVAIDTLKDLIAFQSDPEIEAELARLYTESERFSELASLHEVQIERTTGERRIDLMIRLSDVLTEKLNRTDAAADVLRKTLIEDPHSEEAKGRAEALVFGDGLDQATLMNLVLALEAALRRDPGQADRLAAVLMKRAGLLAGSDAVACWVDAAEIQTTAERYSDAFASLLQAIQIQPGNIMVLDALVSAARSNESLEELCDQLEELTEIVDADTQVSLLLTVARTSRDELGDIARAVDIYDRLLEMMPGSIDVLREMDALLKIQNKDSERIPLLREMVDIVSTVEEKRDIYSDIAALSRATGDLEGAIEAFKWVFERRPSVDSLDEQATNSAKGLLELYQELDLFGDANELRELPISLVADSVVVRELVLDSAKAFISQMDVAAWGYLDKLLEGDPKDLEALDLAVEFARQQSDDDRLDDLLSGKLLCEIEEQDRIDCLLERAALRFKAQKRSLDDLVATLKLDGKNERAIELLQAQLDDAEWGAEAAQILDKVGQDQGINELRTKAHEALIALAADADAKALALNQYGSLLVDLERPAEAVDVLAQAYLITPLNNELFELLFETMEATDRLDEFEVLTNEAAMSFGDAAVCQQAAVALVRAGRLEEAARILEIGNTLAPDNTQILAILVNIYQISERPKNLLGTYDKMLDLEEDAVSRGQLLHSSAAVAREELKDFVAARRYLEEAIQIDPLCLQCGDELSSLLRELEDYESLYALIKARIDSFTIEGGHDTLVTNLKRDALEVGSLFSSEAAISATTLLLDDPNLSAEDLDKALDVYLKHGAPEDIYHSLTVAMEAHSEYLKLITLHREIAALGLENPTPVDALKIAFNMASKQGEVELQLELAIELIVVQPDASELVSKLIHIARESGRSSSVVEMISKKVETLEPNAAGLALARAGATLASVDLSDFETAAKLFEYARQVEPDDIELLDGLIGALGSLKRKQDIALVYESEAQRLEDFESKVENYFKALDYIEVSDGASRERILTKILEYEPGNLKALVMLEEFAKKAGNNESIARLLTLRIEHTADLEKRRPLVMELVEHQERVLGDRTAAIKSLEWWLTDDGGHDAGWRRLEGLLLRTRRYEDLVTMYEREADAVSERELKIAALKKAISIHESYLRDPASAGMVLYRMLEVDPGNSFAYGRLTKNLEVTGEWDALVELLSANLAEVENDEDEISIHLRLADILLNQIEDVQKAVTHLDRVVELKPDSPKALKWLDELLEDPEVSTEVFAILKRAYGINKNFSALRGVLSRRLATDISLDERRSLLIELSELDLSHLKDPVAAFDSLSQLFVLDPGDKDTLAKIESVAKAADRFDDLYHLFSQYAQSVLDVNLQNTLHLKAAEIAEHHLNTPARAVVHYAAYLKVFPEDTVVLERLGSMYAALNRPEDQVRILKSRILLTHEAAATADLRLELARLQTGEFGDPVSALEQVRLAIELGGDWKEASELLRRLSDFETVGAEALLQLVRLSDEHGDDETVLWAGAKIIERGDSLEGYSGLHHLMASTAQRLGRRDIVFKHLAYALELSPSSEDVLAKLLTFANDGEFAGQLFSTLKKAASQASWPGLERSLYWRAFNVGKAAGVAPAELETCMAKVLTVEPVSKEVLTEALKLYEGLGDKAKTVGVLEQLAKASINTEERGAVLLKLANLHSLAESPGAAAQVIEEAVSLDPDNVQLLQELVSLRKAQGDHAGLADALMRLANVKDSPAERREILLEHATIQEELLGDPQAARVSLELLRRQDPHDLEVLGRLENIYEDVGDYALLVQMLHEKFDGDFPLEERIDAAIWAASVYEAHLNNYPAAIAIARRAFELAPKNAQLIEELIRLYYLAEDWANLVTAMVHKAGLAIEVDEKIAILTSAADIADTKLGDLARAGEIADVIIRVVPDNTHANLIQARRLEQQGRTGEALLKFRKLAIDAQDSKDGVEALVGLARLGLAVGDTGKDVEEALEAIMAVNPEHKEANVLLKTLLEKTQNFTGLVALLERDIERVTDESELAKMSFEIAEIYLNKLNSAEKFIEWADKAYQLKPDNPKIVAGIVNFYLRSGERQRSIPYLEWLVNYLEGKRRLRELPPYAHELGKTFEEIGELDKAILYYRLCHEYDAANMINGMALARLYMNQGEHDKALRIFQPLILKMDSLKAADREVLLLSLAEIYVARNDKRRASQYVMRVLSENPDNKDAQKMLEKGL